MGNVIENEISSIVSDILEDYKNGRAIDKIDLFPQPDKDVVVDIVHKLLKIVYPGYFWDKSYRIYTANNNLSLLMKILYHKLMEAMDLLGLHIC